MFISLFLVYAAKQNDLGNRYANLESSTKDTEASHSLDEQLGSLELRASSNFELAIHFSVLLLAVSSGVQTQVQQQYILTSLEPFYCQVNKYSLDLMSILGIFSSCFIVLVISTVSGFNASFLDQDAQKQDIRALYNFEFYIAITIGLIFIGSALLISLKFNPLTKEEREAYQQLKTFDTTCQRMNKLEEIMDEYYSKSAFCDARSLRKLITDDPPNFQSYSLCLFLKLPFDMVLGMLVGTAGGAIFLSFDYLSYPLDTAKDPYLLSGRANLAIGFLQILSLAFFLSWLLFYHVLVRLEVTRSVIRRCCYFMLIGFQVLSVFGSGDQNHHISALLIGLVGSAFFSHVGYLTVYKDMQHVLGSEVFKLRSNILVYKWATQVTEALARLLGAYWSIQVLIIFTIDTEQQNKE